LNETYSENGVQGHTTEAGARERAFLKVEASITEG
jgi:hypothetical protein